MQLLNRQLAQFINKRNLLIATPMLVLVVALIVSASVQNNRTNSNDTTYTDPGTGEVVSNPKGKAAENYNQVAGNDALLLGFSKLIDAGLTASQLELVQSHMQIFSNKQTPRVTELSLATNSISFSNVSDGSPTNTVSGKLTANRTDVYDLLLSYDRITTIRTVVKKGDTVLYDSGVSTVLPKDVPLGD